MEIFLHNTLSGKKELFKPLKKGHVGMYHCGPTVYWDQQLGNMRAMVEADLIRRTFMLDGYDVNYVRNYTDVGHLTGDNQGDADTGEDRMEKAARREHAAPEKIADKYIANFERDIALLNILPATHSPRATEHIADMIDMVKTLIDKGYAYVTPLAVYFDVTKFKDYTKLSGQKLDDLESGEGHGSIASDPNKKHPQDFALWFLKTGVHTNALQTWPSPWGEGFPGWHIECSAMSKHFLGPTLDIHMGGVEHVSIHHTNEIAQSEAANGVTFVDYWLHNEHLVVDNKRMGKSEGNALVVPDVVAKGFDPLALRYFFLQAHYRSKQNFTWQALEASQTALKKMRKAVVGAADGGKIDKSYQEGFLTAVHDDFNFPAGLAVAWEVIKDPKLSDMDKRATLLYFDKVFGLELGKKEELAIPADVQKLLDARAAARIGKDFKRSDELRDEISRLGYEVKDSPNGQIIAKK
ncbi:MAG: cysteine--tRNA ligase [Patescibacteria group bacterium]|nr:cysteine--tRNA ligase [Patescibacteria group bacterium]MDE2116471.1 cysteine--tRNA ligase [Patescibacteria group bacterium]